MRPKPDIDETLLTAYALGELDMDADERERVAAHVESDVDARRFVEDVRESAGLVVGALDMELVDGLAEFQHEMIERRLRELHGEPEPLPFRPAVLRHDRSTARAAALARGARFRRWLPTLASAAASVLIIAGTLGFFLRFNQNKEQASGNSGASGSASRAFVMRPSTLPETDTTTIADTEEAVATEDASDANADGEALAVVEDDGPVEGMVEPKSVATEKPVKKAPAKAPTAVAAAGPKKPATPAPVAVAKPKLYRSPEAVEARRTSITSALIPSKPGGAAAAAGRATKAVSASPVRDGQALDKTAKTGPTNAATPKLYENPFRTVAEQTKSSFRVPPFDVSYKRVEAAINQNRLPATWDARVEELLNHFPYAYPAPTDNLAVGVSVEVATCPWDVNHRLARVALKARDARPNDAAGKPVAWGLKANVEFNAATSNAWRLIGYETGEAAPGGTFPNADLAAGATVTALYEIAPVPGINPSADAPLNLFTVSVRYHDTVGGQRETIKAVAADTGLGFDRAGEDFRFASAVAAFGMRLRDSRFAGTATFADVIRWASAGKGADESGQRTAFIDLARRARDLAK